jgi:hypothetical protein
MVETPASQTLDANHAVLYVPRVPIKLGQVTRDSAQGLTPARVFEERYAGSKALADDDIEATDLFVVPKTHGANFDYDDDVRKLIHHLHTQGKCPFDALFPGYQIAKQNTEALLGFDRSQHLSILKNIIQQYFGLGDFYDTRNPLSWRWKQEQDIHTIVQKLSDHKLCLFAAYTSRGKTKISMEVAHRLLPKGGIVLVTTPITDTKKSFEENCTSWHFGPNRQLKTTYMDSHAFAKTSVQDLKKRAQSQELIFIVLTVQDLRWGPADHNRVDAQTTQLRKKYAALSNHVDLWIRDERHAQYNGEVTNQRLHTMTAAHELDLTATPYNCYDKYDLKHVHSRTLLWGLKHQAHTHLPSIRIDAIASAGMKLIPQLQSVYNQQEGYDPRKLFLRQNQNFVMQREILALARGFYENPRSRAKNPLSIENDVELSAASKLCGMWVLPSGQDGDGAADYLPDLALLLNSACEDVFYILPRKARAL